MPVTNVKSQWVDGNLVFYDGSGNVIMTIDGTNRKLDIPVGSELSTAAAIGATDLASSVVTGAHVADVADDNLIGGVPVLHRLSIADQASGSVDYTLTHKTRIVDAWCVKQGADGHATEDTIQVSDGTNAITDAMAIGAPNDNGITRAASIDDAYHEIAAAGTLGIEVVKGAGGGNDTQCTVYVLGLRVA